MKAKITFFPLGNADTTLIQLTYSGKTIIWDYANMKTDNDDDKRCDLPVELDKLVSSDYDVACFTHFDEDHIHRMSEYFYLQHDKKYQSGDRKKIKELWVPAAVIIDKKSRNEDDKALRDEAVFRLKSKKDIKIFSKPDKLKDWLNDEGISYEEVKHLIIDAGTLVPGWNKLSDDIEFFVHSPFVGHVDDYTEINRNECAIVVQATFNDSHETKLILGADEDSDKWRDIVKITRRKKNDIRLNWDIFHISHHCSYKAINVSDKGKKKTTPTTETKWLFEDQGNDGCILISPSDSIDFNETDQPPHFHAYNYYKEDVSDKKNGEIEVTMEHPDKTNPEPLTIIINDNTGAEIERVIAPMSFVINKTSPRAG